VGAVYVPVPVFVPPYKVGHAERGSRRKRKYTDEQIEFFSDEKRRKRDDRGGDDDEKYRFYQICLF
jgi:hypothetical protein